MIGVFVAIGWSEGPWLPIGIIGATGLLMAVVRWRSREDRRLLRTDPAAGRQALDARAARAGTLMARATAIWIACSVLLVIALLASRF